MPCTLAKVIVSKQGSHRQDLFHSQIPLPGQKEKHSAMLCLVVCFVFRARDTPLTGWKTLLGIIKEHHLSSFKVKKKATRNIKEILLWLRKEVRGEKQEKLELFLGLVIFHSSLWNVREGARTLRRQAMTHGGSS